MTNFGIKIHVKRMRKEKIWMLIGSPSQKKIKNKNTNIVYIKHNFIVLFK